MDTTRARKLMDSLIDNGQIDLTPWEDVEQKKMGATNGVTATGVG